MLKSKSFGTYRVDVRSFLAIAFVGLCACGGKQSERSAGTLPETISDSSPAEGLGGYESETGDELPSVPQDLGSVDEGESETGGNGGDPWGELPAIPAECESAQGQSNVGCLFYGVDLNQADEMDYETLPYAIAISNVQRQKEARVQIEQKVGGSWQSVAPEIVVEPLDLSFTMLPDLHQEDSGVFIGGAYRVRTDVPVIAYQFSPVDGVNSFSSDASLLLPVSSWDTIYRMVGYPVSIDGGFNGTTWTSYMVIVASEDGTMVEVTPSVNTDASLPEHMNGPTIPAGTAGTPMFIELNQGDVANVAVSALMSDLSGSTIVSDEEHPIAVFSGTECSFIPAELYACDHLEEQLSGAQQWGTHFVAARVPVRAGPGVPVETSLWQITASEDNTSVEFLANAGVTGLQASQITMQAGESVHYYVGGTVDQPGDFEVIADKPIALVNYMQGEESIEDGGAPGPGGDPAMVQSSPVDQFLDRYVVMVPLSWENDVAVVTRLAGSGVELDGTRIPDESFYPVGSGDYEVARISVADGVHTFDSVAGEIDTGKRQPFSVAVVGYDSYDSYAYLGGTGTGVINPIMID